MGNLIVATIVLVALIGTIRHLVKKFRSPKSNCCNGGCGTCNYSDIRKKEIKS